MHNKHRVTSLFWVYLKSSGPFAMPHCVQALDVFAWSLHFAQYHTVAATFCSKRTAPSLSLRWCLHTAQEGNWHSLHRVLRDAPKTLISFSALHSAHVFLFSDLHCVHTYISCLTLRSTPTGGNAARGFIVLHVAHFWCGHAMQ